VYIQNVEERPNIQSVQFIYSDVIMYMPVHGGRLHERAVVGVMRLHAVW